MTLRYTNGYTRQAILLDRTDSTLLIAVEGSEDSSRLDLVNNHWVTEDCEVVQVIFEWQRAEATPPSEADCVCSAELGTHLLQALFAPKAEVFGEMPSRELEILANAQWVA